MISWFLISYFLLWITEKMQELYVDNTILQGIHKSFLYQNFNAFCFEIVYFSVTIRMCVWFTCMSRDAYLSGHMYWDMHVEGWAVRGQCCGVVYLFPQLHGFQRSNSIHQACITNISVLRAITLDSTSPFYCHFLIQRLCCLSWLIFNFFTLTENTVLGRHAMWIFAFS